MANIRIEPGELISISQEISGKGEEINSTLGELDTKINSVAEVWEGASQNTFFQQYDEMLPTLQKFPEVIQSIAKQLNSVAEALQAADEEISRQIQQ